VKTEDGDKRVVDSPHLLGGEVTHQLAEATAVDGTNLFDQHTGALAHDLRLGSERRWSGTPRRGSHDHDRAGKEFVGLHDNAEPVTVLLVAGFPRRPEAVDVTAEHEAVP
jgi:hypothetical protein